jgi:hypothetical protein
LHVPFHHPSSKAEEFFLKLGRKRHNLSRFFLFFREFPLRQP